MKKWLNFPLQPVLAVSLIFFVTGCGTVQTHDPSHVAVSAPLKVFRGTLEKFEGYWMYRACYAKDIPVPVSVINKYNEWAKNQPDALTHHYVEFLGTYNKSRSAINMQGLRLAAKFGGRCEFNLTGSWVRAGGEEPPWITDLSQDLLRVRYENRLRRLHFPLGTIERKANQLRFDTAITGKKPYALTFEIEETTCMDQRGDIFPYSTRMQLDDAFVEGCARDGNLMVLSAVGRYAAKLGNEIVDVYLNADMTAEVKRLTGLEGEKKVVLARGNWSVNNQDRINVKVLSPKDGGHLVYVIHPEVRRGLFLQTTPSQRVRLEPIEGQGDVKLGLERLHHLGVTDNDDT